ncbi:hypothetical protein ACFE04_008953 [Oxalis oulophora]
MQIVSSTLVSGVGVNWGTQATHPLAPTTVVRLLKDNGFTKVKLFDADSATLSALSHSGIEVMVGIPNDMLYTLANNVQAAVNWVSKNVSVHVSNSVNIRYVAVGNEQFLKSLNGTYIGVTLPALQNIQSALIKAGLGNTVSVTVPLNADVYESPTNLPSDGNFRADTSDSVLKIVDFLSTSGSPFTVNIYPFISLYDDPNFPADFAFFDGSSNSINDNGRIYDNVFDANLDTLIWSLQKNGYGNMSIIVGEIGWPSDGDKNANLQSAQKFNQGFLSRVAAGKGTPMRSGPVNAYIFSLIDEDAKSIQPGNFERHWGIFYFDGKPKYQLKFGTSSNGLVAASGVHYLQQRWCVMSSKASLDDSQLADSVSYACSNGDCTSLGYGTSCGNLDLRGNVSYAFNNYYQMQDQAATACQFPDSLSVLTDKDPSTGNCKFIIMIDTEASGAVRKFGTLTKTVRILLACMPAFLLAVL